MDNKEIIITIIFSLTVILFVVTVFHICYITLYRPDSIDKVSQFEIFLITSISGILATNLGVYLGLPDNSIMSLFSSADSLQAFPFQKLAVYAYLVCLTVAFIVWALKNFTSDPKVIVPVIEQLSKTLVGVMLGALAIGLEM